MDSKIHFENYYKNKTDLEYSKSLLIFFENLIRPKLPLAPFILDLGSGSYSLFEDIKNFKANIYAFDFSSEAIKSAPQSKIQYREANISDEKNFLDSSFDLIFDSHCLNCLTNPEDRERAFKNIFRGLKDNGLFASELMVQPINKNVAMPGKIIKQARELEEEILSYGFQIIYFMITKDTVFESHVNGEEINCDVLRVIARK